MASFKIGVSKVQDFGNFELSPMCMFLTLKRTTSREFFLKPFAQNQNIFKQFNVLFNTLYQKFNNFCTPLIKMTA